MAHCENCPVPGVKDKYDSLPPGRKREDLVFDYLEVGLTCDGDLGCDQIFAGHLNNLIASQGGDRRYTAEELKRNRQGFKDFAKKCL